MTRPQTPGDTPAGWYPDPWVPGGRRWWDGDQWTSHLAPGAVPPRRPSTDGFAIASLVLGIMGGSILAIILGFVARSRIKGSGGLKEGSGLATAGIVLGFIWIAGLATLFTLGATGVLDSENADDYSGRERDVAAVVDRFEELLDDEKTGTVCDELLTREFASSVSSGAGKPCSQVLLDEVGGKLQAEIDVHSIVIRGDLATVALDEGGENETWRMVLQDGKWRISAID